MSLLHVLYPCSTGYAMASWEVCVCVRVCQDRRKGSALEMLLITVTYPAISSSAFWGVQQTNFTDFSFPIQFYLNCFLMCNLSGHQAAYRLRPRRISYGNPDAFINRLGIVADLCYSLTLLVNNIYQFLLQ